MEKNKETNIKRIEDLKSNMYYLYKAKDPDNSFEFWISEINQNNKKVYIITEKGTDNANVFSVSFNTLNDSIKENLIELVV